ncbi:MAG: glycosyltransferase family 4 protein [Desulfobacterium sp.]|nr:glycosyltransferase family 4 protein [Desulfobacterium sp.]
MKVLFVSSANRGGIGPIVKAQGESLSWLGIAVDYYGITGKGARGYLSNILPLRKHILKTSPDIVHAHYSLCGIVAALTFATNPLVVSLMGSDTKTGLISKAGIRFFFKFFWDRVIIKSSSMQLVNCSKKCFVIPNGVDFDKFRPMKKDTLKNKKIILFLADPARESKNFTLARDAFHLLDTYNAELKVRYGVPQQDIPQILNAADIVLLTSKWEGSPNVVKEAMACNCPVVATDVGDVAWLFGNEPGYFLTRFDPRDVADKIRMALAFAQEKGKPRGREKIRKLGLDSETVARRIVGVYETVLGKK